nr:FAD-dependent oxidoreductase [Anaerolineae bacterium]
MSKSILIIGGGIIGLSIAYYATEKGHRVTLVERGGPTHDMASLGNAGMIVPSHITPLAAPGMVQTGLRMMWNPESPFYIKPRLDGDLINWGLKFMRACTPEHVAKAGPVFRDLSLASRQCYENWAAEFGNVFGLVRKGLLELSKTPESLHEAAHTAEQARKLGIPAEVLTAEQVAQLEPNVRWDVLGGVYYPRDCHLSPMVLMSALTNHLEARGVQFLWNTEVVGWEVGKSQEPRTKNQESRIESQESSTNHQTLPPQYHSPCLLYTS